MAEFSVKSCLSWPSNPDPRSIKRNVTFPSIFKNSKPTDNNKYNNTDDNNKNNSNNNFIDSNTNSNLHCQEFYNFMAKGEEESKHLFNHERLMDERMDGRYREKVSGSVKKKEKKRRLRIDEYDEASMDDVIRWVWLDAIFRIKRL